MLTTKKNIIKPKMPRIGNKVVYLLGTAKIHGIIVEDRGNIGAGGRRLFRIESLEPDYEAVVELPTDEFEVSD